VIWNKSRLHKEPKLVCGLNHDYTNKEQKFTVHGINHEGTKICGMEQIRLYEEQKFSPQNKS
jgi:hypothetical protein